MTVRNPNLDEEIIGYDTLQTDEINTNMTEIGTIKQQILTILSKLDLISDWVIDSGVTPNGKWVKWNSGKLTQEGTVGAQVAYSSQQFGFAYYTVDLGNFPIAFVGAIPEVQTTCENTGQLFIQCEPGNSTLTKLGTQRVLHQLQGRTDTLRYNYYGTGRWK